MPELFSLFNRRKENAAEAPKPMESVQNEEGEKAEQDVIQSSVLQTPLADNPFIAAEENEEYKRMEREFADYRRRKVLAKIDMLVTSEGSEGDIREEFKSIAAEARARSVVMPRLAAPARKALPDTVKIEVLVDYPFVSATKKAIKCEIKEAQRLRASTSVGVNLSAFASGNSKQAERRLKELKKLGKRTAVYPMLNVGALSLEQRTKLAKMLKSAGFGGVRIIAGDVHDAADAVKLMSGILGEQCPVEAVGRITEPEQAEELLLAGAEKIITTGYRELSRKRLDDLNI